MKKLSNLSVVVGLLAIAMAVSFTFLEKESAAEALNNPKNWIIISFSILIIIALMAILNAIETMKEMVLRQQGVDIEAEKAKAAENSFGRRIMKLLTKSTPVEQEESIDLHHEYDGIRELDNKLPPWWLWGFYISIVWALVYLVRVHVMQVAPLPDEEYKLEMAAAEEAREAYLATAADLVDENSVTLLEDAAKIEEGKALFLKHCALCHVEDGGGAAGPNLTDAYWLHGNSIQDIFKTIKYGVPTKGMISWQDQLNPSAMQKVASFVKTLEGTTPANPKEAQGELIEAVEEQPAAEEAPSDTTLIEQMEEEVVEATSTASL